MTIANHLIDHRHVIDTGFREYDRNFNALKDACGASFRAFPNALWIEPKYWAEKARDNDRNHTWALNYSSRFTNQNPTHECTCHSLIQNAESSRNRHRAIIFADGPKINFSYPASDNVYLSPLSVYAIANPGQWGGANVLEVLNLAQKNGILPDKTQPKDYAFKHQLIGTSGTGNQNQSAGRWITERSFPQGWKDTARLFRPREVVVPESWEQAVCLVLHGHMVSVGRNGHAIPWARWLPTEQLMAYPDSYNIIRYDSLRTVKSAWYGSFSIITMTTPDDWKKPNV